MNATKIEWCDFTWNPVVGCTHGCEFCYARKQAKRQKHKCKLCYEFKPHLHPERLGQPAKRKKPARIFVCSMGDLFDPQLDIAAIASVIIRMDEARQHTFLALTKRPEIAKLYAMPSNVQLGVSVTDWVDQHRISALRDCDAAVRFVSYEPAMGWLTERRTSPFPWDVLDWLIIGAETGNRKGKVVPKREWIADAVKQAQAAGVAVFVKDNIVRLFPEFAGMQEFPDREGG